MRQENPARLAHRGSVTQSAIPRKIEPDRDQRGNLPEPGSHPTKPTFIRSRTAKHSSRPGTS